MRTHKPIVEFKLAAASVVAIVYVHWRYDHGGDVPPVVLLLPILFIILAKWLAATPIARAATRAYLLYFFAGLVGLATAALQIANTLECATSTGTEGSARVLADVTRQLPSVLTQMLLPLLCGVGVYAACSALGSESSVAYGPPEGLTESLSRLDEWLSQSDAPEAVRQVVADFAEKLEEVRGNYSRLAGQAEEASQHVQSMGSVAQCTTGGIAEMGKAARELSGTLSSLRDELHETRQEIRQIQSAVHEMDDCVEQFSQVASHRILNFEEAARA